ncbi:hypothetical protein PHLH8_10830 [Pseudomonas sp. Pc102]|uniref:hypothetical protein n=1 Tax=Pseudomonas sp. Pc102 TaxID=2678261 RepID=UPI001BCD29EA|nr:hypothetical protein [Pseudomonas sp. Pc102]BBP81441.1 hypothetical protein PHLH8_10830 [Pseudomonas sp. Pc102]
MSSLEAGFEVGAVLEQDLQSDYAEDAAENAAAFALIEDDPDPQVVNGEPEGASIRFVKTGETTRGRYLMAKVEIPPARARRCTCTPARTSGSTPPTAAW